jgi:uncharacterized RDD family membrane protein YckC
MTEQPEPAGSPQPTWTPPAPTRPGPMAGFHYAGFWVRFLAILLDVVVLAVITGALASLWGPTVTFTGTSVVVNGGASELGTLIGLVYFIGFWAWRGQTPGMMPFNMQVVGVADGKKIDVVRGLLRYVGIIISIVPLFLGLIWAAFDARKQGWHDKIAGTVVIRPN